MGGTITIASGFELADGEVLTTSKLNRMVGELAARVDADAIGTRELADGSIPLSKLASDLQADIGVSDGAISTAKLEDGCLAASGTGRAKMAAGFVTEAKLENGAVLDANIGTGAVTAGKLASGIGVANGAMGTLTSVVTLATGGWRDTGLSVVLTPARSTSKVLIMAHVTGANSGAGAGNIAVLLRLTRNGTALTVGDSAGSRTSCMAVIQGTVGSVYSPTNGSMIFLDSPGSTSALTYKVQARTWASAAGNYLHINRGRTDTDSADYARGACSIVAVELLG
jgi:hypothetical protein